LIHKHCFVAKDLAMWLKQSLVVQTLDEAVAMCNAMIDSKIIHDVSGKPAEFSVSQKLHRFVDSSWFENENQKFKEAAIPCDTWHKMLPKFKDHE